MKNRISKVLTTSLTALLLAAPTLASAQDREEDVLAATPATPLPPPPGAGPMMMRMGPLGGPANGIPPQVAQKIGLPSEMAQRVQELTFEANEALIPLEAELKKAQLRMERLLSAASPDENAVLRQVEDVGRAETAVRRNRIGLLVQIKKLLGPDLWRKLEAEMGAMRIERRIEIRRGPGADDETARPGTPPRPAPAPPPRKP